MLWVFCLEGEWGSNLKNDRRSVRPLLDLIKVNCGTDYIYRDIGTVEELYFYLRRLTQRTYRNYRIVYLGFHGEPEFIRVGRQPVQLDEVGKELNGRCRG